MALLLQGCNTTSESDSAPPDAKALVLAHKNRLWKDADSIKGASITAPYRHLGFMWHVCLRLNAKNSFGAYAGEKDNIVGLYDDGRPPAVLYTEHAPICDTKAHEPFPDLNGDYRAPAPAPQAKAKRS